MTSIHAIALRVFTAGVAGLALAAPSRGDAQFIFGRLVPPAPAVEANGASTQVDVSADGRTVVFASTANNWFPGQQPGDAIISADLVDETYASRSRNGAGTPLNGNSFGPVASRDGRFVAFTTQANNLDVGTPTSGPHVVRKDRDSGVLALASATLAGTPASGSAGGQARDASISADGRFVAFRSDAANLVAGDGNGADDLFVKDMQSGTLEAVSRDLGGAFTSAGVLFSTPHAISDEGQHVLFHSSAGNLVAGVNGGTIQVYLRDRIDGTTELVSRNSGGDAANSQSDMSAISPSGRFVSFRSFAGNLGAPNASRVYLRDRLASTTSAVPLPIVDGATANGCRESDVSDAGSVILACFFPIPVAQQIFLHVPGAAGTPFLISSDTADVRGNQDSAPSLAIDASGLSMAFESLATNLAPADGNGVADVFVLVAPEVLQRIFSDGFESQ